jgi:hypothetical protein
MVISVMSAGQTFPHKRQHWLQRKRLNGQAALASLPISIHTNPKPRIWKCVGHRCTTNAGSGWSDCANRIKAIDKQPSKSDKHALDQLIPCQQPVDLGQNKINGVFFWL